MAAPDLRNPSELSEDFAQKLKDAGFKLQESINKGVRQQYNWTNGTLNFSLTGNRGYYDCDLFAGKTKKQVYPLILLMQFIRSDKNYYVNELRMADLQNTLEVDQYVDLFCKNSAAIKTFFGRPEEEAKAAYEAFRKL